MNEDMSEMIKNLSTMMNGQNVPDNIKNILNSMNNNNVSTVQANSSNNDTSKNYNKSNNSYDYNFNKSNKNSNNNFNKDNSNNPQFSNFSDNNSSNTNNIFGNIDMNTILKMQQIMNSMNNGQNDPRANLLQSLKPYLKESRKNKVDQYIQLMKMGKIFEIMNPLGGDSKHV